MRASRLFDTFAVEGAFLVSAIILFVIGLWLFIKGKELNSLKKTRPFKFIPFVMVLIFLINVMALSYYYTKQAKFEKEDYFSLLNKYKSDSLKNNLWLSNHERTVEIDSLKVYSKKLTHLIDKLKKQQSIIGKDDNIVDSVKQTLSSANLSIKNLQGFNEIVRMEDVLPKNKGVTTSGNTSNFQFDCPIDRKSKTLDLVINFQDSKLIEKILCIYLTVDKIAVVNNQQEYESVFQQTYLPQNGINKFRILNYLNESNTQLNIGYILKSDSKNEYPRYEKVTCSSN